MNNNYFFVFLLLTLLTSCSQFTPVRDAAYRTLYDSDGNIDREAFISALEKKFQPGTDVSILRKYSTYGGCTYINGQYNESDKTQGIDYCEIYINSNRYCADVFRIDVETAEKRIVHATVSYSYLTCD